MVRGLPKIMQPFRVVRKKNTILADEFCDP